MKKVRRQHCWNQARDPVCVNGVCMEGEATPNCSLVCPWWLPLWLPLWLSGPTERVLRCIHPLHASSFRPSSNFGFNCTSNENSTHAGPCARAQEPFSLHPCRMYVWNTWHTLKYMSISMAKEPISRPSHPSFHVLPIHCSATSIAVPRALFFSRRDSVSVCFFRVLLQRIEKGQENG